MRTAVLGEVEAESVALSMPVSAVIVANAWVKVAEAFSTFVVIITISVEAAAKSLFFFENLVFTRKLFLIENIRQHTVLF